MRILQMHVHREHPTGDEFRRAWSVIAHTAATLGSDLSNYMCIMIYIYIYIYIYMIIAGDGLGRRDGMSERAQT